MDPIREQIPRDGRASTHSEAQTAAIEEAVRKLGFGIARRAPRALPESPAARQQQEVAAARRRALLAAMGIEIAMVSGDNRRTADAIAAGAMALSSVSVLSNSLRLRRFEARD
jgi:hypothetical protein